MVNDATLIDAYCQGNARALNELMIRHRGCLMGFLERRVGDDAEELHQELWVKVARNLERYRDDGKFRAFLFAAARRLTIDHHRRRRVRPRLVGSDRLPSPAVESADPVEYGELVDAVEQVLSTMHEATAEVVRLRLTEQLTFAEIASQRGEPLNTVLSRMHRGLKQLRQQLDDRGLTRMDA
jgi:RNA polymerase sigma-70 factor, ECF subfamily